MNSVINNDDELNDLRSACLEVAKTTFWDRKPIDSELITQHADQLFKEAIIQYEIVDTLGGSMPLITRAVHYMNNVHAIPPLKDDVRWFTDTLRALLELSCPNTGVDDISKLFLNDLQKGISESLLD